MNLFSTKDRTTLRLLAPTESPWARTRSVCPKKGVMSAGSHCRSFRYDPLLRTPPRPAKMAGLNLNDEDFSL